MLCIASARALRWLSYSLFVCLVVGPALATMGCSVGQMLPNGAESDTPIHAFEQSGFVDDWLVLGPFPNPESKTPLDDGSTRKGFGTDFLRSLGGEARAALTSGTEVGYIDADGSDQVAVATPISASEGHIVDLAARFGTLPEKVAYAFTTIHARRDSEVECFFGSDDWAKVWVNGELVHSVWQGSGRGVLPRQEHFPISLKKGLNRVLVKVDQNTGPWSFIFEIMPSEEAEAITAEIERKEKLRTFLRAEIVPVSKWGWVFPPGEFPVLKWEQPGIVEELLGTTNFAVRWFDAEINEVERAEKPGRYGAYMEFEALDGRTIRRALTFYCRPVEWQPWRMAPYRIEAPYLPKAGVDEAVWNEQQSLIALQAGEAFIDHFFQEPSGALFLAGLSEMKELGREATQLDWPSMRNQDYHLWLKQKILGSADRWPELKPPRKRKGGPATILTPGTPEEAGFAPEVIDRVRQVCRDWVAVEGEPTTVLVARNGRVVLHEAFGTDERPATIEDKFPLASLTKCHAGLMLAQFLDQGIIDLDDPVGKFLPDFPTEGPKAITLRQCMAHLTGFEGHGAFGGMSNPWLDNILAHNLEVVEPGKVYLYNGMGFDLGGKVMEIVAGKSFFRLMHENFFIPLGQDDPTMVDLGYGIDCTVMDLARIGQLMLNKGSYGDIEFFSEDTFENIVRPKPLKEFFPELEDPNRENAYNLGLHIAHDRRVDPDPDDDVQGERLFSDNSLMHGAASGALLRADLDTGLVIAASRFTPGKDHALHAQKLFTVIVDAME